MTGSGFRGELERDGTRTHVLFVLSNNGADELAPQLDGTRSIAFHSPRHYHHINPGAVQNDEPFTKDSPNLRQSSKNANIQTGPKRVD